MAADLVRRDISDDGPNKLWVTDITEHPTTEGKVFCCAVLDAFSRKVVGWSIDSTQTAALVTNALGMAIKGRDPKRTVIHSDRGTQGGFNRSSQHLSTEVNDGQASWVDDRVDGQGADEIAGQACQRPSRIPQGRPSNLPARGHDFSPPVAIGSPRLSPSVAAAQRRP